MATGVRYFANGAPSTEAEYEAWGGQENFSFSELLGDTMVTAGGVKTTDEALAGKKKVAILFSGQWCPWCREFDPLMTEIYEKLKDADPNDTEVVYMSVDTDEDTYNGYVAGKPWLAVPYNRAQGNGEAPLGFIRMKVREETCKPMGTLQARWKLKGVPNVVVLDGKTGQVIHSKITRDKGDNPSDGIEFTEKAPHTWLVAQESGPFTFSGLLGDKLVTAGGERPTDEALAGKKQVALLFSGQWCSWCREFDGLMTDTYEKVKAKDPNDTEVVYLSVDADEESFKGYAAGKPWPAVPYNKAQGNGETPIGFIRKKVREETGKPMGTLQEKWGLGSVPSIVVLDGKTGRVLTSKMTRDKGNNASDGIEFTEGAPSSWLEVQGS